MNCRRCGRVIKNPKSMVNGMGPVCWRKSGGQSFPLLEIRKVCLTMNFQLHGLMCERDETGTALTNIEHAVVRHSPTGFEWGYLGSGPADLAYNVLRTYGLPEPTIEIFYQRFKEDFIAKIPREGGTVPYQTIHEWVIQKIEQHKETTRINHKGDYR